MNREIYFAVRDKRNNCAFYESDCFSTLEAAQSRLEFLFERDCDNFEIVKLTIEKLGPKQKTRRRR